MTFLPLEQQDLPVLSALKSVCVCSGGQGKLASVFQLLNLAVGPNPAHNPQCRQNKISIVLKGKWPGSHQEETSPTEYNGWSFSCLVVTHCPHTTHTYLYTNTPQLCPYAHTPTPPNTRSHLHHTYPYTKGTTLIGTSIGPAHSSPFPNTPTQHHTYPPFPLHTPTSALHILTPTTPTVLDTHSHTHSLPSRRTGEPGLAPPRRESREALGAAGRFWEVRMEAGLGTLTCSGGLELQEAPPLPPPLPGLSAPQGRGGKGMQGEGEKERGTRSRGRRVEGWGAQMRGPR